MIVIFRTACQKAYWVSSISLKGSNNLSGIICMNHCFAKCLVTAEAFYKYYYIGILNVIFPILKTSNYLQFVSVYFPLLNGSVP